MKRHSSITLQVILFSTLIAFTGCSKKKPDKSTLVEACKAHIAETIKKRPLSRLEERFFKDGQSRGLLHFDQLEAGKFVEGSSSATVSGYIQEFSFIDAKGKPVRLHRSSKSGGLSLDQPNLVTVRLQCKVTWSLFKHSIIQIDLKVFYVSLEKVMKRLQGLSDAFGGEF